ncbi:MAG: hypothetical protein PHV82_03975 [Victivallaceae bacterium]|nr:hypothetical protein [Victivallaceae bacterium]
MKTNNNKWKKSEIILKSEGDMLVSSFTSTIIPVNSNFWRVWYSAYSLERKSYSFGYADGVFGKQFRRMGKNISNSIASYGLNIIGIPAHWNLIQPVYILLPDGKERIYFWAHAEEGICRYLLAESRDGINFYVKDVHHPCLYHPSDRAVSVSSLNTAKLTRYYPRRVKRPENEPEAPKNMLSNDATNVYLLADGTFELYTVELLSINKNHRAYVSHDPSAGVFRVIQRRTSIDGIHWSSGEIILKPDENDPDDLQFYYLSVTHTPIGRIGLLGYYLVEKGTMDIEICFSRNGISWERPCRGAGIQREKGIEGISAPHSLIKRDNKYFLFYTSCNFTHHEAVINETEKNKFTMIGVSTIDCVFLDDYLYKLR